MKGVFFQKPLELAVNIDGESWGQGSLIKGNLTITNHQEPSQDEFSNIGLHLCIIAPKKFKSQDPKSIKLISSNLATSSSTNFEFQLAQNCHITETSSSLYILCGDINKPFEAGLLELKVHPAKSITEFKELFENFFKFSFKTFKNKIDKKNGPYIETKIVPPNAPEWTPVMGMSLKTRILNDNFEMIFNFKLKTMSYDLDNIGTKDTVKEVSKVLSRKDFISFGDNLNQDYFRKLISEILSEVKLKKLV